MARTLWMRWTAGLCCCGLMVGCLFHRPGHLPEGDPEPKEPPGAGPAMTTTVEPPIDPPPPNVGTPSPYSPVSVSSRVAGSVEPAASKYDQTDRETLRLLLLLVADVDKKDRVERLSAEEVAAALERLRLLGARLGPLAPLSLDRACFCKAIDGFGQYERLDDHHEFRAGPHGQPGERMQVYVEVRNFATMATRQGQYETRLSSTLEIKDERQQPVATMTPETSSDVSQSPRQDYFLNFQFQVPPKLKPGSYTLWVTVKDVTPAADGSSNSDKPAAPTRQARKSLDFQVCSPGTRKEKQ
jgi:hypothetical protein